MRGRRPDRSVNETVQKFICHAVGAERFSKRPFSAGLSRVKKIAVLRIWSNS